MAEGKINSGLFSEAKKYLVGGVDSPVRAFNYTGGEPIVIKRGKGSKVFDHDNRQYIDYVLSWGSLILGHVYPQVINSIKRAAEEGLSFGATNLREIELAKLIRKGIPLIEKIRFTNSGTEAVMAAVRLARGYTERNKIIKFVNSYHGHADYLLAAGGSGLATLNIPLSAGIPKSFFKDTLVIPYGDKKVMEQVFSRYKGEIAAVLVEPVGGNYGVIKPNIDFLKYLRAVTKKHGVLLIADEIITGFRFNFGSFMIKAGIKPDLICLGKIIGGGLPIGAFGGPEKIMKQLAPLGKVYQASTFAGNPVVMQAGISTLEVLNKSKSGYRWIRELTARLAGGIEEAARVYKIGLKVTRFESMFSLKFSSKKEFRRFYQEMIKSGIYFAPSEYEANFLSFAHTKKDINKTIDGVRRLLLTPMRCD